MIDMKSTKKSGDTLLATEVVQENAPEYPYGMRINLDSDSLAKLGMGELPVAGTRFKLQAEVCVVGTTQHDNIDGKPSRSAELQIEKMDLNAAVDSEKKDPAERMYG